MSHWNYRVFHQPYPEYIDNPDDEQQYFIGECYYGENGEPNAHSLMDHNNAWGDTLESLGWTLKKMRKALKKPIIELDADGHFVQDYSQEGM